MFQTEQHFDQKHSVKREHGLRDEQQVRDGDEKVKKWGSGCSCFLYAYILDLH